MIKDNLILYETYFELGLYCFICEKYDHIYNKCPCVFKTFDKQLTIKKECNDVKQKRKAFLRNRNIRFNCLGIIKSFFVFINSDFN